jgi:flagellar basal-body rod modification protein FlgD
MTVTPVATAPAGASLTSTAPTKAPTKTFDSGMFLNLLVTQLRNQDPSSPMDSTQMISQTSQLASMEQLTSLTKTSTDGYTLQMRSAAANILGKSVSYTDSEGVPQTGVASAVSFSGDTPMVTVGKDTVKFSDLTGLATVPAAAAASAATPPAAADAPVTEPAAAAGDVPAAEPVATNS